MITYLHTKQSCCIAMVQVMQDDTKNHVLKLVSFACPTCVHLLAAMNTPTFWVTEGNIILCLTRRRWLVSLMRDESLLLPSRARFTPHIHDEVAVVYSSIRVMPDWRIATSLVLRIF